MSIDLKISQLDESFAPVLTDFVAVVTGGQTDKVQLGNLGLLTPLTPWTEDIDADTFKLFDLGNVEVNPGNTIFQGLLTAVPAQTGLSALLTPIMMSGQGNNILFYLDDTTISGGQPYGGIQWAGNDSSGTANGERASIECLAREAAGGTDLVFSVAQGNQANQEAFRIFMLRDVGIQPTKKFRFDGVVNGGTWISETSANNLVITTAGGDGIQVGQNIITMQDVGITFTTVSVVPGNATNSMWGDAGGFKQNVPTGDTYEWKKNGVTVMSLDPNGDFPFLDLSHGTQLNAMAIHMENGGRIQWAGDADRSITNDQNGTQFRVDTGDQFTWHIEPNGMQEARLNVTTFSIDNKYLELKSIAEPAVTPLATTGRVFMDSGNSNHLSIRRNGATVDLEATISQTPWVADVDAADFSLDMGTGTISFRNSTQSINGVNNLDVELRVPTSGQFNFKINNITEFTFHPTGLLMKDNPILGVDDITTGDVVTPTYNFERTTPQADDYVIGDLRWRHPDGSAGPVQETYARISGVMVSDQNNSEDGEMEFFVLNAGVEDSFFKLSAQQDRIDVFKVIDFSNIDGTLRFGNTFKQQIHHSSVDGLEYSVSFGRSHNFIIETASEYDFDAAQADFKGNNLVGVGFIESNTVNPATDQFLRLAKTDRISWRNTANSANRDFFLSTSDFFELEGPFKPDYVRFGGIAASDGEIRFGFDHTIEWRNQGDTNDNTLGVSNPGRLQFSGVNVPTISSSDIFTNKTWGDTLDMNNNTLDMGGGSVIFDTANTAIHGAGGDMILDVPTAGAFEMDINSVNEYDFTATLFDLGGTTKNINVNFGADLRWGGATDVRILGTGTGFEFHVGASDTYDFDINSVAQLRLNGTSVDVFGNNIVGVGDLTLNDASDIIVNTTTGTKIATATSQKLGFWNTTPVIQPTHIADPTGGATIDSEARTAINSILAQLAAIGLQAAS